MEDTISLMEGGVGEVNFLRVECISANLNKEILDVRKSDFQDIKNGFLSSGLIVRGAEGGIRKAP